MNQKQNVLGFTSYRLEMGYSMWPQPYFCGTYKLPEVHSFMISLFKFHKINKNRIPPRTYLSALSGKKHNNEY